MYQGRAAEKARGRDTDERRDPLNSVFAGAEHIFDIENPAKLQADALAWGRALQRSIELWRHREQRRREGVKGGRHAR